MKMLRLHIALTQAAFPSESVHAVSKGARGAEVPSILRTFRNCGAVKHHRPALAEIRFEIVQLTDSQTMFVSISHIWSG